MNSIQGKGKRQKASQRNTVNKPRNTQQKVGPVRQRLRDRVKVTSLYGGKAAKYQSTSGTVPAAFVNMDANTAFMEASGKVLHSYEGIDGVSFYGCQPLSTIGMTNTASDASVFSTGTLATTTADSGGFSSLILLSPDDLNGRLAAQANLYTRFVFRDIIIEYVSNCGTSQADSMCLAYSADANLVNSGPATFADIRQMVPSITFPFRTDRAYFHFHYAGQELFYNKRDVASIAGNRVSHQGALVAYADKVQGNVASLGYTNIFYVVEFYNPTTSQAITFMDKGLVSSYVRNQYQALSYADKGLFLQQLSHILHDTPDPDPGEDEKSISSGYFPIRRSPTIRGLP